MATTLRATPPARTPAASTFAWIGAGLFAASLGWFVFSYFVRFPALTAASSASASVLWDVALFTVFAGHHSIFARDALRLRVERLFPGRERSVFVWVASLVFVVICAAWRGVPGIVWHASGPAAWLFYLTCAAGIVLTLLSAAILDVWELAGTRPARHAPGEHGGGATFTQRGPYGWVRHPIYAGWFLVVFSVPVMTATQLVFAVTSCAYLVAGMVFEERSLVAAAPEAYGEYQRAVRWKVIPGLY
jgi:protein-S-isoprenylcysteine O-methyltransferase Ste14